MYIEEVYITQECCVQSSTSGNTQQDTNVYIYVYIIAIGIMLRVFADGLGDRGSISVGVIAKTQKWYLMPPCLTLSIIRYISRVSGAIQGKK